MDTDVCVGYFAPNAHGDFFLFLFDLVVAVVELVVRDSGTGVPDRLVEVGEELFGVLLAQVLQDPDENYVEEAREREREEVDALTRVLAVDARPVVDCGF